MPLTEVHYEMPDREYFAAEGISNSTLGKMKRTPAHCKYAMENPSEPTANMRLGSLFHTLVLEPEKYQERYHLAADTDPKQPSKAVVVEMIESIQSETFSEKFHVDDGVSPAKPRGEAKSIVDAVLESNGDNALDTFVTEPIGTNKRTKDGKAAYAEFVAECERDGKTVVSRSNLDTAIEYLEYLAKVGERQVVKNDDFLRATNYVSYLKHVGDKEIITETMLEAATAMAESVKSHPAASKLLSSGTPEVSIFWDDEETGARRKCRIDFIHDSGIVVDLKSTSNASEEEFARSVAKFGYHRQQAFYVEGFESGFKKQPTGFVFVATESTPPYATAVYALCEESEAKGREEIRELLPLLIDCKSRDEWPAYSPRIEKLTLPRWYK